MKQKFLYKTILTAAAIGGFFFATPSSYAASLDCSTASNIGLNQQTCNDLLEFYDAFNGQQWINKNNWDSDTNICTWHGITCNTAQTGVTEIRLDSNQLSGSLPIGWGINTIDTISVNDNQITNFDISANMSTLIRLYVSNNQLTFLPTIDPNVPINVIVANLNQITTLPTTLPSSLQSLFIALNQISEIPVGFRGDNLVLLNLHGNTLSRWESSVLPRMSELFISNNQFTGLDSLSLIPSLEILHAYDNDIGTLDGINLPSLQYLDVSNNLISSVSSGFIAPQLRNMNVANNMVSLYPTFNTTFLQDLNLSNNNIRSIPPLASINNTITTLSIANNCLLTTTLDHPSDIITWLNQKDASWTTQKLCSPIYDFSSTLTLSGNLFADEIITYTWRFNNLLGYANTGITIIGSFSGFSEISTPQGVFTGFSGSLSLQFSGISLPQYSSGSLIFSGKIANSLLAGAQIMSTFSIFSSGDVLSPLNDTAILTSTLMNRPVEQGQQSAKFAGGVSINPQTTTSQEISNAIKSNEVSSDANKNSQSDSNASQKPKYFEYRFSYLTPLELGNLLGYLLQE